MSNLRVRQSRNSERPSYPIASRQRKRHDFELCPRPPHLQSAFSTTPLLENPSQSCASLGWQAAEAKSPKTSKKLWKIFEPTRFPLKQLQELARRVEPSELNRLRLKLLLRVALSVHSLVQAFQAFSAFQDEVDAIEQQAQGDPPVDDGEEMPRLETLLEEDKSSLANLPIPIDELFDWIEPFERDYLLFAFAFAAGLFSGFEGVRLALELRAQCRSHQLQNKKGASGLKPQKQVKRSISQKLPSTGFVAAHARNKPRVKAQ